VQILSNQISRAFPQEEVFEINDSNITQNFRQCISTIKIRKSRNCCEKTVCAWVSGSCGHKENYSNHNHQH